MSPSHHIVTIEVHHIIPEFMHCHYLFFFLSKIMWERLFYFLFFLGCMGILKVTGVLLVIVMM